MTPAERKALANQLRALVQPVGITSIADADLFTNAADEIERLRRERNEVLDREAVLREALERAKRPHYYCEDPWYSCPKTMEGCADKSRGADCNCGADKFNSEIDEALRGGK